MTTSISRDTELTAEQAQARERIYALPLETLDPANADNYPNGDIHWIFERLRHEDPVHLTPTEHTEHGHYWALTKWEDIQAADTNHEDFSAEGLITIAKYRTPEQAAAAFNDGTMTRE